LTDTYLHNNIRSGHNPDLFYSIALHLVTTNQLTSKINERFDELTVFQKHAINSLIDSVAKHSLSFEDHEQPKRIKDIFNAMQTLKDSVIERPQRVTSLPDFL